MQPQTSLKKQFLLSVITLFVVFVVGFALIRPSKSESHDQARTKEEGVSISKTGAIVTQIKTVKIRSEAVDSILKATGQVVFATDKTVKISPRIQGRVKEVFVRVGDHVQKGQTIATLESVDASTAQNTLRQAENRLRLTKSVLDRQETLLKLGTPEMTSAQANLDQASANAEFKKEALRRLQEQAQIGGFTQKPLEDAQVSLVGAKSDYAQAQADLAQSERDLSRKTKLIEIGVIAKADYELAENVLQKVKLMVQGDREKVDIASQAVEREKKAFHSNLYADQQLRAAQSDVRQTQLQEQAAKHSLILAKTSILRDVEQARSDAKAAKTDADSAARALELLGSPEIDGSVRLRSPISGVVTDRQVSPGQVVDQSQMTPWQMFVICDSSIVSVDADIYEKDIASISPGLPVKIKIGAFPNHIFVGTIKRVAPTLDTKSRTIKIHAEITNSSNLLKDGMYAEVEVRSIRSRKTLTAPLSAIQRDGDSDFVFVANHGKYFRRKIVLGALRNASAVIEKGVDEEDEVVTQGAIFLNSQLSGG